MPAGSLPTKLFDALGGTAACRRLSAAFYARVESDPVLRPLFPGKSFTCAIEEFSAFLVQFLGGPGEDSQRRWWLSLRESHERFRIGEREREAWLALMALALADAQIAEPAHSELLGFFRQASMMAVNQGKGAADVSPGKIHDAALHIEISQRWEAQGQLEKAVAAMRTGDAETVIALAEGDALENFSRPAYSALLAQMIRSRQPALGDSVRRILTGDPALAHGRFAGRTLLHEAAGAGSLATVQLLLELGADANGKDSGSHTPLYALANECTVQGAGKQIVAVLVTAGGDVEACEGVKRCTALHMAARRGNVEVAAALLDRGARIEARDSLGETPLRRAVNCDKVAAAKLLVARGADIRSPGSKGLTPLTAARSAAMKQALVQPNGPTAAATT